MSGAALATPICSKAIVTAARSKRVGSATVPCAPASGSAGCPSKRETKWPREGSIVWREVRLTVGPTSSVLYRPGVPSGPRAATMGRSAARPSATSNLVPSMCPLVRRVLKVLAWGALGLALHIGLARFAYGVGCHECRSAERPAHAELVSGLIDGFGLFPIEPPR